MHGEALSRAYAGADVMVFPSLTDTFGLVMLGKPRLRHAGGGVPRHGPEGRAGGRRGRHRRGGHRICAPPCCARWRAWGPDRLPRLRGNVLLAGLRGTVRDEFGADPGRGWRWLFSLAPAIRQGRPSFLQKKKQKTLSPRVHHCPASLCRYEPPAERPRQPRRRGSKSFLVLFFEKRRLAFSLSPPAVLPRASDPVPPAPRRPASRPVSGRHLAQHTLEHRGRAITWRRSWPAAPYSSPFGTSVLAIIGPGTCGARARRRTYPDRRVVALASRHRDGQFDGRACSPGSASAWCTDRHGPDSRTAPRARRGGAGRPARPF